VVILSVKCQMIPASSLLLHVTIDWLICQYFVCDEHNKKIRDKHLTIYVWFQWLNAFWPILDKLCKTYTGCQCIEHLNSIKWNDVIPMSHQNVTQHCHTQLEMSKLKCVLMCHFMQRAKFYTLRNGYEVDFTSL